MALPLSLGRSSSPFHFTLARPGRALRERIALSTSPLGRYTDVVASITVVLVLLVGLGAHAAIEIASLLGASAQGIDTGWTDQLTFVVVGFVFASVAGGSSSPVTAVTPSTVP